MYAKHKSQPQKKKKKSTRASLAKILNTAIYIYYNLVIHKYSGQFLEFEVE
jgi:hypothetical protein